MKCQKVRYRDRVAALFALSGIDRTNSSSGKAERRAYFCQHCHAWHLTSETRRP